jgi:hypothetical protein
VRKRRDPSLIVDETRNFVRWLPVICCTGAPIATRDRVTRGSAVPQGVGWKAPRFSIYALRMTSFARRFTLIGSVIVTVSVIGAGHLAAQRPSGGAQGGPATVSVDFRAIGADGQPVAGLQPSDVSIRIGGKNRTITSLEFKKAATGGGGAAARPALPAPFAVNEPSAGRQFLIVIDNESLRAGTERNINASLEPLLASLAPGDRVAVSVAPRDTVQLAMTSDIGAVRAALSKITGIRPASVSTSENQCRTFHTLNLLRSLMQPMTGSETPTTMIYFSSGLVLPTGRADQQQCEVTTDQYNVLGPAAANARVNFYIVQGDEGITGRDNGLDQLSGALHTGLVLRTSEPGLSRIIAEASGYYMATVQPDPTDRLGQTQRLEVKVNKEGVTTLARADAVPTAKSGRGGTPSTRDMVATTSPFTDLQLRATAVASRGQGGKMTVLALAEAVDPSVKLTSLTAVIVAPGAGKAAFVANADDKQLANRPVVVALAADPGKYRLRVAAVDSTGKAGAVDYDLDANFVEAGPIKVAGLLIAGPRGEGYAPQLVFTTEPEVALQVDLFGNLSALKMGAKFEIAATPDGKALAEGQVGGAGTSEPDKFVLSGKIPIAALAPGDYVVRVIVQAEGHPEGRLMRTIRKAAK